MDLIVHNHPLKDGGGHLRLALVHGEVVDECRWLLDRSSAESFDFAFTASEDEWVQARATLLETGKRTMRAGHRSVYIFTSGADQIAMDLHNNGGHPNITVASGGCFSSPIGCSLIMASGRT